MIKLIKLYICVYVKCSMWDPGFDSICIGNLWIWYISKTKDRFRSEIQWKYKMLSENGKLRVKQQQYLHKKEMQDIKSQWKYNFTIWLG